MSSEPCPHLSETPAHNHQQMWWVDVILCGYNPFHTYLISMNISIIPAIIKKIHWTKTNTCSQLVFHDRLNKANTILTYHHQSVRHAPPWWLPDLFKAGRDFMHRKERIQGEKLLSRLSKAEIKDGACCSFSKSNWELLEESIGSITRAHSSVLYAVWNGGRWK